MDNTRDFLPRLKELKRQKELGRGMLLSTVIFCVATFIGIFYV